VGKEKIGSALAQGEASEYMTAGNWFYAAEPEEATLPFVLDRVGRKSDSFRLRLPALGRQLSLHGLDRQGTQRYFRDAKRKILRLNALKLYVGTVRTPIVIRATLLFP
jgi:hypothetical protein